MANRTFMRAAYANQTDPVSLYVAVAFNATSAPSLLVWDRPSNTYKVAPTAGDGYVKSFTRTGVGLYTLTLVTTDTYIRILSGSIAFLSNTSAVAPIWQFSVASDPTLAQAFGSAVGSGGVRTVGAPLCKFTFFSAAATAADPAATEMALIKIVMQNSTSV